jgi:hypothetical protein
MNDLIFLSVAFGERYIEQQDRLSASIGRVMPGVPHHRWVNEWPEGSKTHKESLYGFKVHAIKSALNAGYKKIIWLDTACVLQQPTDHWFKLAQPVLAARDDNKLKGLVSDKALRYFGFSNCPDHLHLVGGSVYVWDFDHAGSDKIFNTWAKAEKEGLFGSATEKLGAHRHDEALLSLSMFAHGYYPASCDAMKYNIGEGAIINKHHFK